MPPKKWKLLSSKDVSPSKWFPIESRTYELPDGRIVDDFTVTTLGDVAMIIPITRDRKVVLVNQFKPGIGDLLIQFPAGRIEQAHRSIIETAQHELEEEVGIKAELSQLQLVTRVHAFSTKATEVVHIFLADKCEFNSSQKLDRNEEIEILQFTFDEMDAAILNGQIWDAEAIAGWELAKKKFPHLFSS
ncbi:MAG TPA: NUDIX hydrolase [Patescibacteria group bacterium]